MSDPLPDSPQLSEVLKSLSIHEHLCVIYETRDQQSAETVPFLSVGLERGEKCLYVAEENTIANTLEALRTYGVEIDMAVEKGMLKLESEGHAYLKKGYFDPDETIRYWARNVREAKAAGFPALRFAGEPTWAFEGGPGAERLIEYEARLNLFLTEYDAVCLCQYNNQRFSTEVILQVLRTHPLVIYGGHVCKNPYYVPPDEFLKPNQPEAEVQRWLDNIQKYEKVERALRTAKDEWEQSFDAISDYVCILDTSGAILRANKLMRERFEPIHGNLTGLDFHQVFLGPIRQDPAAPWETALLRGVPFSFETKLPNSNGWYTVSSYPLFDDKHQRWGAIFMVHDITKRKRAEEELRRLSARLLRSQDEERRKIARDLHDSTGQDLVALATTLGQIRHAVPPSNRKARKLISESRAIADLCIREIRTLAYLLHPPMLEQFGLEDAIRDYVEGLSKRSGIKVKLDLSPNLGRLPRDTELALFRVVQEGLTNVQRHSGSRQARIRIERDPKGIKLEVSDKGPGRSRTGRKGIGGFPFETGVGISSMNERVKQIGGRMEIKSASEGTTVLVTVPVNEEISEKTSDLGR
jgi:two-component system, NarL family, sensor kinase